MSIGFAKLEFANFEGTNKAFIRIKKLFLESLLIVLAFRKDFARETWHFCPSFD
jgi:hypothetical protein